MLRILTEYVRLKPSVRVTRILVWYSGQNLESMVTNHQPRLIFILYNIRSFLALVPKKHVCDHGILQNSPFLENSRFYFMVQIKNFIHLEQRMRIGRFLRNELNHVPMFHDFVILNLRKL